MACQQELTALEQYVKKLKQDVAEGKTKRRGGTRMLFPMYTMPSEKVLNLQELRPHEALLEEGEIVEFGDHMGNAAFVSHQWICSRHPDPDLRQFRQLQGTLRKIMTTSSSYIDPDISTEFAAPGAPAISVAEFRLKPLFVWYDFFSIPQERYDPQQEAIDSIASYVAKCTFFFVLQPVVESPESGEVLGPSTWASRGWCRLEKTIRELQPKHSYIVIKSEDHLEAMTQASMSRTIGGPPGEGHFTIERDRKKLGTVLAAYLSDLIFAYLEKGDILAYRAYLNLQPVFLGGFSLQSEGMAPMFCPIPGFESDADGAKPALKMSTTSAEFLHHNGFKKVNEHDKCGWSPLLYAVLRGDPLIVRSLLEDRADPNGQTRKPNPILGVSSGLSTSLVCTYFRGDKECLQELISARADLEAGWIPPMCGSALGNHPDCIRLLCEAGDTPHRASFVNITVIMNAAYTNALEAAKELLAQSDGTISLSRALGFALYYRGDAEMVQLLLDAKADMNEKMTMPLSTPYGLGWTILGIQRRFGAGRRAAHVGYHAFGSTPLMFAILTGQHEGAAVLLAAKAKVDVRNSRGWTALDLAKEHGAPQFLIDAIEGDLTTCSRIATSALTNRYPVCHTF